MAVDRGGRGLEKPGAGIAAALHRCPLFAGLDRDALGPLAGAAVPVTVERRQRLYAQGEPPEAIFVIGAGRVRLCRVGRSDRALTLGYRIGGEIAGEEVLAGVAYRADAVATERVNALRLPAGPVLDLAESTPGFGARLARWEMERRLEVEARIEALLTQPVESRVADFLTQTSERHGVPDPRGILIGVKLTHQEIAGYVGSTRETVTLVLGELRRRGLLTTDHRRLVITDTAGLRALT